MRWVIGDIHGMRLALESLMALVTRRDASCRYIFTGDYINRGPDSRGVLNVLTATPNADFVRGNHDDILDIILHGKGYCDHPTAIPPISAFTWFMQHGLAETLMSYGADYADLEYAARHPSDEQVAEAVSPIPQTHRDFIRNLKPVHEENDLFVAHAMWDIDTPDKSILPRLLESGPDRFKVVWGRYSEKDIAAKKRWRRTGYFGHTPVQTYRSEYEAPLRGPQIVLLDTGAALGVAGRLSAVCAETGECIQVNRSGQRV